MSESPANRDKRLARAAELKAVKKENESEEDKIIRKKKLKAHMKSYRDSSKIICGSFNRSTRET